MFGNDDVVVEIIDCFVYNQPKRVICNKRRDYSAVSFRVSTDCNYKFDSEKLYAPKSCVVFVPADLEYITKTKENGNLYVFHFHILNHTYKKIELIPNINYAEIKASFEKAINIWQEKPENYKYMVTSIFYDILSKVAIPKKNSKNIALRCAEFISENIGNPDLTVCGIAEYFHVSETYLRRKFKEEFLQSPKSYLLRERINYAKYLIKTDCFTQTEIAKKCGFSDVKYFRIAFKAKCKITVSEYKKLH